MDLYNNKVDYETICAAVQGDVDALMSVVRKYEGYLNTLSRRERIDGDTRYEFIDETIKAEMQNKLIEAILQFRIE